MQQPNAFTGIAGSFLNRQTGIQYILLAPSAADLQTLVHNINRNEAAVLGAEPNLRPLVVEQLQPCAVVLEQLLGKRLPDIRRVPLTKKEKIPAHRD